MPAGASPGPQPVPLLPPVPAARDVAYPGTIRLEVDARDIERRIVRVRETLPVAAGPLVLLYPEYVPGSHRALNGVDQLAGLVITGGGKRIAWRRDPVASHAFHVDVPRGVTSLDIRFEQLGPTDPKQGRIATADALAHFQWHGYVLYPAGVFTRGIAVEPSLTLPTGWQLATALDIAASGATTRFRRTDLETLVDSPVMAGRALRRIDLDPNVRLDLIAEQAGPLAATEAQLAPYRTMVVQADRLLGGTRPFDHYDVLLALTEAIGGIGREHHRSTEIVARTDFFTGWDRTAAGRTTVPHEYVHSWNGKFRVGADSWAPDFNTPIRNSLLWVYEGQTQYWGQVLAARSGLVSKDEALDALALLAAGLADAPGREWRSLDDTVNNPQIVERRPQPWLSRGRGEDYYSEGLLIWLDADTLIRERTNGARSLDDFARDFFAKAAGDPVTRTYEFADVVAALNRVLPFDWAAFLTERLTGNDQAPLDGLARGGYRLAWSDTQNAYAKGADTVAKRLDLTWSLGVVVDAKDATLSAVQWNSPAFRAGLTVGTQLIAVGQQPYTPELLVNAVRAAAGKGPPVTVIVKSGGRIGTVAVDWHGGLRYPRLERIPGTPARLDAILSPKGPA